MIEPEMLYNIFKQRGLEFFAGVPDSLLKYFCAYVTDNTPKNNHVITANEGNAIGLATGYYLATKKIPVVYMQNSGLGNCVNPLTSLADKDVYSIPILLVIGWRGEPGTKDEPQHVKKGMITLGLLNTMGIPYAILPNSLEEIIKVMDHAVSFMKREQSPFALVIRKDSFSKYTLQEKKETNFPLQREDAIRLILPYLEKDAAIISTTGKTSRELFEFRMRNQESNNRDFLTVGSMGHASSIALGIALHKPNRQVYCFDGDGALIMHMGSLAIIGQLHPHNFKHIIFNNFAHDSVGGQPTAADTINIPEIAKANGYKAIFSASSEEELLSIIKQLRDIVGPVLLEVRVNKGARDDLMRPTTTPLDNKTMFMKSLDV